jgi:hypothetical protein
MLPLPGNAGFKKRMMRQASLDDYPSARSKVHFL